MAAIESGNNAGGKGNVDAGFNVNTTLPSPGGAPQFVGAAIAVSQIDDGSVTGLFELKSIDIDHDYKVRIGAESHLEAEVFDYAAQNTGKFNMVATTMVPAFSTTGYNTNSTGITTTTTGSQLSTSAYFPIFGATNLFAEVEASFTNQPVVNTIVDWGLFHRAGAIPFAPTDGMFFP